MSYPCDNANPPLSGTESVSQLSSQPLQLPRLLFPSELRADDVVAPRGIEAYVDESSYSSASEDELDSIGSHPTPGLLSSDDIEKAAAKYDSGNDRHASMTGPEAKEAPIPSHLDKGDAVIDDKPQPSHPCTGFAELPSRGSIKLNKSASRRSTRDPNLVTWDGPDDATNPHNWPKHRRWTCTILIASFAFIAPMASTMIAPALDTIAEEFKIESDIEEFLVMSIFLLAFAIGPFLWGPLSEVFGRVRVMQSANMIFLLFNTVCGFAKTKQQMMAFRFLSGIGGSAPQAIGGGILSDCFRAGDRGLATAIYSLMPFLSPAVAPIMGGYLTQFTTWRWVFWATSIFDVLIQILCLFLLKETFAPAILAKKAKALQKLTGNRELHTKWQGPDHSLKKLVMKSLVRPLIMLFTQPALQAMALFRAYQYGLMYLVLATFSRVFEGQYNQGVGRASLNYLSLGVGFVIGLQISGGMQDKIYTWCKTHQINPSAPVFSRATWTRISALRSSSTHNDQNALLPTANVVTPYNPHAHHMIPRKPVPVRTLTGPRRRGTAKSLTDHDPTKGLPEYRLPLVLPFSLLIPIGLFWYGWSAQYTVHWIVPNIGTAIFAIGLIVCFNCAQAYVVDTYTTYAASATGAAAFVRTMAGFSFPLFAPKMYDVLGIGWGNSMLGFVSLGLGIVAPVALWRWGGWLRSKSTYCTD